MVTAPCHYCGVKRRRTRDHIVPRALGGKEAPWNFVRACQPCNAAKADSLPGGAHLLACSTCQEAIQRWRDGERQATRAAERLWVRYGGERPSPPLLPPVLPWWAGPTSTEPQEAVQADSEAVPRVRWDGMHWIWTGRKES